MVSTDNKYQNKIQRSSHLLIKTKLIREDAGFYFITQIRLKKEFENHLAVNCFQQLFNDCYFLNALRKARGQSQPARQSVAE